MSYVDGYVLPLHKDKIETYRQIAEQAGKVWIEHGALEYKECVLEDMKGNEFCASFPDAFGVKDGETVVFAYVTYNDRAHRDAVNAKVMADPRIKEGCEDMPVDSRRMAYGGFRTLVSR